MTNIPSKNDLDPDDEETTRLPSSTRRSASNGQAQASRQELKNPTPPIRRKSRLSPPTTAVFAARSSRARHQHPHWLLLMGTGLLIMLLGWLVLSALLSWWQLTQDDWHYGRPRTFQTDAVVGHHDSAVHPSHFIAVNLDRHVAIIELSGGDPSQAHLYIGPVLTGDGQDLAPVTLSFRDVTGDGKPDLIVQVQQSRFVLVNDQGIFRPATPGEVKTPLSLRTTNNADRFPS